MAVASAVGLADFDPVEEYRSGLALIILQYQQPAGSFKPGPKSNCNTLNFEVDRRGRQTPRCRRPMLALPFAGRRCENEQTSLPSAT